MTTAASLYPPARARGPFLLVERQNGIRRTGPFERSSKHIPNSSTRHTVIPIARAGSRPNLRPSSNRLDDANSVRTHGPELNRLTAVRTVVMGGYATSLSNAACRSTGSIVNISTYCLLDTKITVERR